MCAADNHDRMADLEARIAAAKGRSAEDKARDPTGGQEHYSAVQVGWRMVTELVAGLGLGFGIGYGLDWLFGTTPFLMLVMTLLGFAAGVKTMMSSARELQEKAERDMAPGSAMINSPGPAGDNASGAAGDNSTGPAGDETRERNGD